MGTNYYKVRKLSDEEKKTLIKAIEDDRLESISYDDEEGHRQTLSENDLRIHIGKDSYGWRFLFDHNDWKHFGKNRRQIEAFISSDIGPIIDEYGEEVSVDDFWKLVTAKENFERHEPFDSRSYVEYEKKNNPDEGRYAERCYQEAGHDFYVDGLRFASFTDFS